MKPMTPKQRMVNLIRGDEVDQLPFVSYAGMSPGEETRRLFGDDSLGMLSWRPAYRIESANCSTRSESFTADDGYEGVMDILDTPVGSLVQKRLVVPAWGGPWGFLEHFVKTSADLEVLLAYFQDRQVFPTSDDVNALNAEWGEVGIAHVSLPRTPYQQLWIEWSLIEDVAYLMAEAADLVDRVMRAMGEEFLQAARATAQAAKDCEFYHTTIGDNITAPMIGTDLFETWCLPYYNQAVDILADADVRFMVHMDGDLKPLWPSLDRCNIGGFDSLSPPPDNDTPVGVALQRWPEMMVWANFPSSVHLREPAEIRRVAEELLEEGGHTRRFWIQISEDMPPEAWRKSFPEIIGAIRDFGKP